MSMVHLLDDDTVNKIAAGEVVERPASVIKELIENAVDAGASVIETEIMAGGTSLMRVTDNGCGMSKEDAVLAVKRHATSKIKDSDDILQVPTLGFRGEALPTIAAVSRFSLVTRRPEDELGVSVRIMGGKKPEVSDVGAASGTTVRAEDLFFNTPARKKFMKTTHTEGMKINDCVIKAALAEPGISFRLINNNKVSVKTPGSGSLRDAIVSIYGGAVGESLLPLSFEDTDVKITGFLTKPSMLRSSRAWQTFVVNGRVVENKAMARAIDNAYHSLLPKAGYPLAVLIVEVPARSVDVNVHPRKAEIKFEDEGRLFKAVYKAVVDAVRPEGQSLEQVAAVAHIPLHHDGTGGPSFSVAAFESDSSASKTSALPRPFLPTVPFAGKQDAANFAEVQRELLAENNTGAMKRQGIYQQQLIEPLAFDGADAKKDESLAMVPIGQVDLCFIIAQDGDTLYIIDQHAAHERVLYDRFSSLAEDMPSQQLLVHLLLDFTVRESELLERHQEILSRLGFDLAKSGENQFRLCSLPSDIPVGEAETTLRKILGWLMEMHDPTAAEIRHACLAMTACKAAIKRGDELNLRQMQLLLEELSQTARPYTCPHGRPTILRFTGKELAKMFKRT